MDAIEIEHLRKSYGSFAVLRDLSLRIAEGETYGLLGAHGSGKSTFIHVLLGFLKPSGGKIRLLGMSNLDAARQRMGYLPEHASYHLRYSAREYLSFLGRFSDLSGSTLRTRIDEQLRRVGLIQVADRSLSTFSRGMLQRFGVAQALLANPSLLLIDEPLYALDTSEQREMIEMLAEVRAHGYSMLICTSYTHMMADLCDRIGVLAEGRIADETDRKQLQVSSSSIHIQVVQLPPELRAPLSGLSAAVECSDSTITLRPNSHQLQSRVLRLLLDAGVTILSLEPLDHPLERFYLQAVQQQAAPLSLEQIQERSFSNMPAGDEHHTHDALLDTLLLGHGQQDHKSAINDD